MQRVFATDRKDELESKIDDLFKVLIAAESDAGNLCNLSIELSPNACEGRCLISGHDFEPGSILIEIPKQFLINYRFVLNDPKMRPFFNWYSNLSAVSKSYSLSRWDALLLLLIHSKHNNESSFLHKFTMTLPKQFDTPEYFDPRLVDLMPIHVKREVKSRLADLDEKYERIKSLLDAYSESNGTRFMIDYFTKEEFRWAFCSMNSRVFYMEEVDICTKEEIQLGKAYFGDLDQMSVEIDKMSIDNIKGMNYHDQNLRLILIRILLFILFKITSKSLKKTTNCATTTVVWPRSSILPTTRIRRALRVDSNRAHNPIVSAPSRS